MSPSASVPAADMTRTPDTPTADPPATTGAAAEKVLAGGVDAALAGHIPSTEDCGALTRQPQPSIQVACLVQS